MTIKTLDQTLTQELAQMDEAEFRTYLFLEAHPDLPGQWLVNSDDPLFLSRMGATVRDFRAVAPFAFDAFQAKAEEEGYQIVFLADPSETFEWLKSLNQAPEVKVNSTMENTTNGFLPFQVHGFNFVKALRGAVLHHSTGTGKTVTASGLTDYHREQGNFDICIWAVKTHNRINTQRAIKRNVDLDSIVIDGTKQKRYQQYAEVAHQLEQGEQPIVVLNYEKFREDTDALKILVEGRKVFVVWDEMPTKLRNRATKLYKAVAEVFYTSFTRNNKGVTFYPAAGKERPSELRQIMLSATPIVNSPVDWFNCVRLIDPTVYGTVNSFNSTFVASWDYWGNVERWRKLDYMGAKAAHIVHQVDKNDPDIAAQFPEKLFDAVTIELDPRDRKIYDALTAEYRALKKRDPSALSYDEVLAAIGVLQMLCNNPKAVLKSAKQYAAYEQAEGVEAKKQGSKVALKLLSLVGDEALFTDEDKDGEPRCAKLLRLRDDLSSGEKTVLFTAMNETTIPYITSWLDRWGVRYVTYHGGMSMKERQAAEDAFVNDSEVQVFISSDSGSDSINLEVAALVIHYDDPWTWATKHQRENRIDRITSEHAKIRILSYHVYQSVEDRKAAILAEKYAHHVAVLKGDVAEQSYTLRTGDYLYILTGENGPTE